MQMAKLSMIIEKCFTDTPACPAFADLPTPAEAGLRVGGSGSAQAGETLHFGVQARFLVEERRKTWRKPSKVN
jgi:hypothetical protein